MSSVFWMSGILSFRPAAFLCMFDSIYWYFLFFCFVERQLTAHPHSLPPPGCRGVRLLLLAAGEGRATLLRPSQPNIPLN